MIIKTYENLIINIIIIIKKDFKLRRIIRFKNNIIISIIFTLLILIKYRNNLLNKDFLFEF